MKHRSVISFVLVAAALFSLPQLSHDLQALKGAAGARLHRELLRAFLNLPAGDSVAAAPVARPADTQLASCPQERSGAPATRAFKTGTTGRVEGRATDKRVEQTAMIGDPAQDPINQVASIEVLEAADEVVASLPEVLVKTEVAMIIPPESGIDPRGVASALASTDVARVETDKLRFEADGLRVAYTTAARLKVNNAEWQKATEDTFRKLNRSLPGAYEFRVVRDGAKSKVLKFKCSECPLNLPRAPRQLPVVAPQPAPSAPVEWVSE